MSTALQIKVWGVLACVALTTLVLISGGDQLGGAAPFVHTMFR